jgi:hypothetical protein
MYTGKDGNAYKNTVKESDVSLKHSADVQSARARASAGHASAGGYNRKTAIRCDNAAFTSTRTDSRHLALWPGGCPEPALRATEVSWLPNVEKYHSQLSRIATPAHRCRSHCGHPARSVRPHVISPARGRALCKGRSSAVIRDPLELVTPRPRVSSQSGFPSQCSGQVSLDEAEHFLAQSSCERRYAPRMFGIIPECGSNHPGFSVRLRRNPQPGLSPTRISLGPRECRQ